MRILSLLPQVLNNPRRSIPKRNLSKKAEVRLSVFADAGLIPTMPTQWQLIQGQVEMAPYVLLPDDGDDERYAGALLGHPLLRSPLVFYEIGLDHLRIGHGLHAQPESLYRHLNFVYHQDIPMFDLQLVQSLEGGLDEFERYTQEIQDGSTTHRRSQRERVDLVLPNAEEYRNQFLRPNGWIDQARRFEYPQEVSDFLRPEFTSLVRFANYCAAAFEPTLFAADLGKSDSGMLDRAVGAVAIPSRLFSLATRRMRR